MGIREDGWTVKKSKTPVTIVVSAAEWNRVKDSETRPDQPKQAKPEQHLYDKETDCGYCKGTGRKFTLSAGWGSCPTCFGTGKNWKNRTYMNR